LLNFENAERHDGRKTKCTPNLAFICALVGKKTSVSPDFTFYSIPARFLKFLFADQFHEIRRCKSHYNAYSAKNF